MPTIQSIDYVALAPPLALAIAAVAALVCDLFATVRRALVVPAISAAGFLVALGFTIFLTQGPPRSTFCLPGGECSYVVDTFTLLLQVLFGAVGLVVLLMSLRAFADDATAIGEYHFLLLAAFTGMYTIAASRDLIMLVISLEIVSLPVFGLVALRSRDGRGGEAALKFFLVSVLATAVTLYGMSLVYGVTGSVYLNQIAAALAHPHAHGLGAVTAVGVVLVLVGFAFKVSAVPFHFWAPDTYVGAPIPVAALLAVASKAAGITGLVVLLVRGFGPYAHIWGPVLAGLAALTMTAGNLIALRQRNAVRLLAWSSIAQAGYILLPLAVAATAYGREHVLPEALAATLAYLVIYAAMNLGAFACVVAVARRSSSGALADYRGLARRSPALALALAFFLACLAGLPPGLSGLFAKVVIFKAAVAAGLGWLVVLLAVNVVIALYYYVTWAASLFAEPVVPVAPDVPVPSGMPVSAVAGGPVLLAGQARAVTPVTSGDLTPRSLTVAISLAALASIAFSVAPQLVLHLAASSANGLLP